MEGLEKQPAYRVPCVVATQETLRGYGEIVDKEENIPKMMKNTIWPKCDGWRSLSPGTGNEQLPTKGLFHHYWIGDVCHADNDAVGRKYKIGVASKQAAGSGRSVLVRELNYHPCGSQIIFPRNRAPFITLLGAVSSGRHTDDLSLEDIKAFYFDGSAGLHIFAGTWHQPSYAVHATEKLEMIDWQSSVHACVVLDTLNEWNTVLEVPLQPS